MTVNFKNGQNGADAPAAAQSLLFYLPTYLLLLTSLGRDEENPVFIPDALALSKAKKKAQVRMKQNVLQLRNAWAVFFTHSI